MKVRARVIFKGKVQGVWFRANAQVKSRELGLSGWVRNLPDGSVEAVFQGPEDAVKDAIQWCSNNQPHARVDSTQISWEYPANEKQAFEILY